MLCVYAIPDYVTFAKSRFREKSVSLSGTHVGLWQAVPKSGSFRLALLLYNMYTSLVVYKHGTPVCAGNIKVGTRQCVLAAPL